MPVLELIKKMTVEEFLALPECSTERHELVDGEIIKSPLSLLNHQEVLANLVYLLRMRVGTVGQVVLEKEVIVRSQNGDERVRAPDLIYIQESRRNIAKPEAIYGAPDILFEILSKSTQEIDKITKRDEYKATGVTEYWIIDIPARSVLIHYFSEKKQGLFQGKESFNSEVLKKLELPCQFSVPEIFEVLR